MEIVNGWLSSWSPHSADEQALNHFQILRCNAMSPFTFHTL